MLSDTSINISSGAISSGIEAEDSLKAVIAFIREHFKNFADQNKGQIALNEKGLSQKLCILLNRNAKKHPFFFHPEFMEDINSGMSPQVDIGTIAENESIVISDREYGESDSFFSIEAKRLPTPGIYREKEYVVGYQTPCGAIERFKNGKHGLQLKYAAIIGYVQEERFEHWFLKINSWIEELAQINNQEIWSNNDKIEKRSAFSNNNFVELESNNSRIVNGKKAPTIKLFHFWVNLVS